MCRRKNLHVGYRYTYSPRCSFPNTYGANIAYKYLHSDQENSSRHLPTQPQNTISQKDIINAIQNAPYHYNITLHLQLSLRPLVHEIDHLEARPVGVQARCWPLAVPGPLLLQFGLEVVFQHLHDVLAQDGEELVAVEGTAGGDVETLCAGVRRDNEVG